MNDKIVVKNTALKLPTMIIIFRVLDLVGLLKAYQSAFPGAMYSGCGGGYLIVASLKPVPGSLQVKVRQAAA